MKNRFLHTLESCWLCLRFPFLYPRNRWDGKHHVNLLHSKLYKLYNEAILSIGISAQLVKDEVPECVTEGNIFGFKVSLLKEKQALVFTTSNFESTEFDLFKILWNSRTKFTILGIKVINNNVVVYVKTSDPEDKTNYGFAFYKQELTKDKKVLKKYKLVNWLDNVLDYICFIPTFTELDAMEPGWRKTFGIQMCKDIKKAILKSGGREYLKRYRIMQIKEKFGYLRWYDNGSTPEVQEVISKYENLSWNTCICCGKPSTKISSGWISPYCDDCYPKDYLVYKQKINGEWITINDFY